MKNNAFVRLTRIFAVAIATLLIQGCASNGYISSSITTGIGLDVSENSQTQIPHVRFGYIRHGLYYIPTGKTGDPTGNVTETPHVVSKIHVSSEFLKGITISEKFAVGDGAGNSEAARQLFADTSTETKGQNAQLQPLSPDPAAGRRVIEQRTRDAMGQETIRARRDAEELKRLRALQKTSREKVPDNKAFSKVMSEIAKCFPERKTNPGQQGALEGAYSTLLSDPILKDADLPIVAAEEIAIVRFFQSKTATDDQRRKLMKAAENEFNKLKP